MAAFSGHKRFDTDQNIPRDGKRQTISGVFHVASQDRAWSPTCRPRRRNGKSLQIAQSV